MTLCDSVIREVAVDQALGCGEMIVDIFYGKKREETKRRRVGEGRRERRGRREEKNGRD